jgi:hypothetical protein
MKPTFFSKNFSDKPGRRLGAKRKKWGRRPKLEVRISPNPVLMKGPKRHRQGQKWPGLFCSANSERDGITLTLERTAILKILRVLVYREARSI